MRKMHLVLLTVISLSNLVIFLASGHQVNLSDTDQLKFLLETVLYFVFLFFVFLLRKKISGAFSLNVVVLFAFTQALLIYSMYNLLKIEYVPILLHLIFFLGAFINFLLLIIHLLNYSKK
jgi:hypothetical protein